uniref:Uncharacterized protein n=1 Tax=Triticum urartu TaxID=4572 RepID=A0A8R7Q9U7_TRIUA
MYGFVLLLLLSLIFYKRTVSRGSDLSHSAGYWRPKFARRRAPKKATQSTASAVAGSFPAARPARMTGTNAARGNLPPRLSISIFISTDDPVLGSDGVCSAKEGAGITKASVLTGSGCSTSPSVEHEASFALGFFCSVLEIIFLSDLLGFLLGVAGSSPPEGRGEGASLFLSESEQLDGPGASSASRIGETGAGPRESGSSAGREERRRRREADSIQSNDSEAMVKAATVPSLHTARSASATAPPSARSSGRGRKKAAPLGASSRRTTGAEDSSTTTGESGPGDGGSEGVSPTSTGVSGGDGGSARAVGRRGLRGFLRRPWFLTTRSAREVGKPVWTGTRDGERRAASRRPREGRLSGPGIAGGEHA